MKTYPKKILFLFLNLSFLFATGCGQNVDFAGIDQKKSPTSGKRTLISNSDLQGSTLAAPQSANRVMTIHQFGGTSVRTKSSSTSFMLTGGVGID